MDLSHITESAIRLRAVLHAIPEPAMHETRTRAALMEYIRAHSTLMVTDMGSWFYAEHRGTGAPIAFRADMDAVSGADGIPGHYCGHDGHCAALAAFSEYISAANPSRDILLIFQPAEEIGAGGKLCAPLLKEKGVGEVYTWHNLPGCPRGDILLTDGTFACASTGLEISLKGTPSHAAYPEAGANPARAIAELILRMHAILEHGHRGIVLGTVIGVDLGSDAYGVSASEGILRLTLRAEFADEFESLVSGMKRAALEGAANNGLTCTLREVERFESTENHPECVRKLEAAASRAGLNTLRMEAPFRWSEDFGVFLTETPGAIFGVGDGMDHPQLHTRDFEFPDGILASAIAMLAELIRE